MKLSRLLAILAGVLSFAHRLSPMVTWPLANIHPAEDMADG
jgi:hypothetical protein